MCAYVEGTAGDIRAVSFSNKIAMCFIRSGDKQEAIILLVPKFAGSNPAEAVGFFRAKKSSARLPSEGK